MKHKEALKEFERPKKEKAERIRKSIFMITINSNVAIDQMTLRQKNKFKGLAAHLFDENAIYSFVEERSGAPPLHENLVQIRDDYNFEIGEQVNRVHLHATVEIDHRSLITLDINRLRDFVNDYMGYRLHINVKCPKIVNSITWDSYTSKQWELLD